MCGILSRIVCFPCSGTANNEKGILADVAVVMRDEDANISSCLLQCTLDNRTEMEFEIEVRDVAHLYHVIDKLRHIPAVLEVVRKTTDEE